MSPKGLGKKVDPDWKPKDNRHRRNSLKSFLERFSQVGRLYKLVEVIDYPKE